MTSVGIMIIGAHVRCISIKTFAGLLTNYFIDIKSIFKYNTQVKNDSVKFLLSPLILFDYFFVHRWNFSLFNSRCSQYFECALFSIVGYIVKYCLNKKFVLKVAM